MSTLWEECFSRKIRIGGWPFGMTVGTQARWLVRTAVSKAGKNLKERCLTACFPGEHSACYTDSTSMVCMDPGWQKQPHEGTGLTFGPLPHLQSSFLEHTSEVK